jgi:hypothetical protein
MPFTGDTFDFTSGTAPGPSGTVISSTKISQRHTDIKNALNTTTSIGRGGTGATTAITAHDALVKKGSDIASSSTINLTTATGPFVDITGTTTVTTVTLSEGMQRLARTAAALPLTASSSLIVNGQTSGTYTCSAGDLLVFVGYASSVVRVWVVAEGHEPNREESIPGGFQTLSASSAYNVTDLSAYRTLRIRGYIIPDTDGTSLAMRFSTNNGSSYDSSGYSYARDYGLTAATDTPYADDVTSGTGIDLGITGVVGGDTEEGVHFNIEIFNFNQSANARVLGNTFVYKNDGAMLLGTIGGARLNTTARDALSIFAGTGNITGYCEMWGVRG